MAAVAAGLAPSGGIEWITPARELDRLRQQFVSEMSGAASLSKVPKDVLEIVAEYGASLPPALTNWHTALGHLGLLNEKIPPLPCHIFQVLNGKCPLPKRAGQELKPDRTPWKVSDTHSLYLIPAGTLNDLETRVSNYGQGAMNAQGEKLYPNENPLRFSYFWDAARQEHGDVSFEAEWILMSNDVLEGSRGQPWNDHVKIIQNLSKKAFVEYQIPTAKQAFGFMVLHKVATGESFYQCGNEQNRGLGTYTRVQEITAGYHHLIAGSTLSGVLIRSAQYSDLDRIGVGTLRRL